MMREGIKNCRLARGVCAFLALLLLIGMVSVNALAADGTVTYDGNARSFVFAPGSNESPTDLFAGLKNVMPGDTLTQTISVKNDASNNVKIRVYLRSLGATDQTADFLSKLTLTVTAQDGTELFCAAADQTAGLTDWTDLGLIYSGGEVTLNVTLTVPAELDNSYQEAVGAIDWEFKVEEFPTESTDPQLPKTGDNNHTALYIMMVGGSLAALLLLSLGAKGRRREEKRDCC